MRITIFGAGYVGVVSSACLLRDGHHVTCVEIQSAKVADLNVGETPIQEPGVAEMLRAGHQQGRLRATSDPADGLAGADMVWICVGTPSQPSGQIDLSAVEGAVRQIGQYLHNCSEEPLIVVRSTVLPGTTQGRLIPLLQETSGRLSAEGRPLVFHPEFLREGTAVDDFDHPPKIVVGQTHPAAAERLWELYEPYAAPRFCLTPAEAEMVKYCDNLFHAVKITFANEVGALAKALSIDARRVADVFCADTKLNISPRYLRPGFAFGGSCLPKDMRAVLRQAVEHSLRLPMLEGIPASNNQQIDHLVARVLARRPLVVGLIGLAFKPNTDDMRESPYVTVAKRLLGEGLKLRIFDPGVAPDRLVGSNRQAVQSSLGHLEELLVQRLSELDDCDTILVNHPIINASQVQKWLDRQRHVLDLADIPQVDAGNPCYEGIAW